MNRMAQLLNPSTRPWKDNPPTASTAFPEVSLIETSSIPNPSTFSPLPPNATFLITSASTSAFVTLPSAPTPAPAPTSLLPAASSASLPKPAPASTPVSTTPWLMAAPGVSPYGLSHSQPTSPVLHHSPTPQLAGSRRPSTTRKAAPPLSASLEDLALSTPPTDQPSATSFYAGSASTLALSRSNSSAYGSTDAAAAASSTSPPSVSNIITRLAEADRFFQQQAKFLLKPDPPLAQVPDPVARSVEAAAVLAVDNVNDLPAVGPDMPPTSNTSSEATPIDATRIVHRERRLEEDTLPSTTTVLVPGPPPSALGPVIESSLAPMPLASEPSEPTAIPKTAVNPLAQSRYLRSNYLRPATTSTTPSTLPTAPAGARHTPSNNRVASSSSYSSLHPLSHSDPPMAPSHNLSRHVTQSGTSIHSAYSLDSIDRVPSHGSVESPSQSQPKHTKSHKFFSSFKSKSRGVSSSSFNHNTASTANLPPPSLTNASSSRPSTPGNSEEDEPTLLPQPLICPITNQPLSQSTSNLASTSKSRPLKPAHAIVAGDNSIRPSSSKSSLKAPSLKALLPTSWDLSEELNAVERSRRRKKGVDEKESMRMKQRDGLLRKETKEQRKERKRREEEAFDPDA